MIVCENYYFEAVNQRVLGSSPRGGAKSLTEMSGFFVYISFLNHIFWKYNAYIYFTPVS
jgi:hypothetical protein